METEEKKQKKEKNKEKKEKNKENKIKMVYDTSGLLQHNDWLTYFFPAFENYLTGLSPYAVDGIWNPTWFFLLLASLASLGDIPSALIIEFLTLTILYLNTTNSNVTGSLNKNNVIMELLLGTTNSTITGTLTSHLKRLNLNATNSTVAGGASGSINLIELYINNSPVNTDSLLARLSGDAPNNGILDMIGQTYTDTASFNNLISRGWTITTS